MRNGFIWNLSIYREQSLEYIYVYSLYNLMCIERQDRDIVNQSRDLLFGTNIEISLFNYHWCLVPVSSRTAPSATFITVNYTRVHYYVASNSTSQVGQTFNWFLGRISISVSFSSLSLSFECFGLWFVISASSRSSSSAVLDLVSLSPFSFLCYRLHIIPPPHLVRGRRQSPFFIFDIRSLLVLFSWKPMLLGGAGERERGWNGRKGGSIFFFAFLLYLDSTARFAINGKSVGTQEK